MQRATDEEVNEWYVTQLDLGLFIFKLISWLSWENRIGVTSKPDSSDYYVLKMLLNGDPGVGKTTFVDSFSVLTLTRIRTYGILMLLINRVVNMRPIMNRTLMAIL